MVDPIKISLDFYRNNSVSFNVKQLDDLLRIVEITCTSNGKKVVLDNTTTSAFVRYKKPDGFYVFEKPEITSYGVVKLILKQSMLSETGRCVADVMLINSSNIDVEKIEDIINSETLDGVGVISTMSFYVNVEATAIAHSELAGIYKKDDFVDIVSKLSATDNYARGKEKERQDAEILRIEAENNRIVLENDRNSAEEIRNNAEKERQHKENERINAEEARLLSEEERKSAENIRKSSEEERKSAEIARANAELTRETNEIQRNELVSNLEEKVENIEQDVNNMIDDDNSSGSTTYSSQKIDSSIFNLSNNLSNPNLLINGDFQVWQRGTTFNLTKNVYTADRWLLGGHSPSSTDNVEVSKVDNGISILINNDKTYYLTQHLEKSLIHGEAYTVTAKINDVVQTLNIIGGVSNANDYLKYASITDGDLIQIYIKEEMNIEWVKLEKGAIATPFVSKLYAEELVMCQRYFYILPYAQYCVSVDSSYNIYIRCDWRKNNMRSPLTVTHSFGGGITLWSNGTNIVTGVDAVDLVYGSVRIIPSSKTIHSTVAYMYFNSENEYIAIDAEIY